MPPPKRPVGHPSLRRHGAGTGSSKCSKYSYLKCLGALSVVLLTLQYVNLTRHGSITSWYRHWQHLRNLKDPDMGFVGYMYEDFPFYLKESKACKQYLESQDKPFETLANEAYQKWNFPNFDASKGEQLWLEILEACHGPLPKNNPPVMEKLSVHHFFQSMMECPRHKGDGGGAECFGDWNTKIETALGSKSEQSIKKVFVESARCALQTEFPLTAPMLHHDDQRTMKQKKIDGWKPKRMYLLSLALTDDEEQGSPIAQACKLVTTALPRGWEVILVEGPSRGMEYRFSDALAALEEILADQSYFQAEDQIVVFADSTDILVQSTPDEILNKYLNQPYEFVFSGHANTCTVMDQFPHNVGARDYVCEYLFPYADGHGIWGGPQYVNTGGWIGTASAAAVVLRELVEFLQRHRETDTHCHQWGQDQLLGMMAFLRSRSLIGLDANSAIWTGGSWNLIDDTLVLQPSSNEHNNGAFCHNGHHECPGMLHFNGNDAQGRGTLQGAFDVLTSDKAMRSCPASATQWGKVTILQRVKGTVKTIKKDLQLQPPFQQKEWNQCIAGKACFGK